MSSSSEAQNGNINDGGVAASSVTMNPFLVGGDGFDGEVYANDRRYSDREASYNRSMNLLPSMASSTKMAASTDIIHAAGESSLSRGGGGDDVQDASHSISHPNGPNDILLIKQAETNGLFPQKNNHAREEANGSFSGAVIDVQLKESDNACLVDGGGGGPGECCACTGGDCGVDNSQPASSSTCKAVAIAVLVALLGLPEGYLFAHAGLYAPISFVRQMRLEGFLLLKVFVSAVGTSMLAQSLMSAFNVKQFEKSRCYRQDNNGWLQVVGGCSMLGVGMAVAGSGPTMLPTQLGAGINTAGMVLVGCLVGGVIYAIMERLLAFRTNVARGASDKVVVEDLLIRFIPNKIEAIQRTCHRLNLYQMLAVPMGVMMIGGGFLVEYLSPHSDDAKELGLAPYSLTRGEGDDSSSKTAQQIFFHPITAGIIVGLNQIPLRFIQDDGQGGSTAIMNMIAFFTRGYLSERHLIKSWKQATQIIYVYGGTLIGGLIGFLEIGQTTHTSYGLLRSVALGDSHWTPWRVFIGGFCMIFGARIAGGCTCGHGISGVSELSLQSFAGAGAIFGCGIAITFAAGL